MDHNNSVGFFRICEVDLKTHENVSGRTSCLAFLMPCNFSLFFAFALFFPWDLEI